MTLADGMSPALSIIVGVAHPPWHSSDRPGHYTTTDNARCTTPSAPVATASASPRS